MSKRHRFRYFYWTLIILIFLLLLLQLLCKPLVEHYGSKFTGRKVQVGLALLNPFSGVCRISSVSVSEKQSDSIFFSAGVLSLNINLRQLLRQRFEMQELRVVDPFIHIVQFKRDSFNFSSLVDELKSDDTIKVRDKNKKTARLGNISISNGVIRFQDMFTPVDFNIRDVNITAKNPADEADSVKTTFSFVSGTGEGQADGFFNLNTASKKYTTHFVIRRLDLTIISQYLREFSKMGKFSAMINADFTAAGNLNDARNLETVGGVGLYNFHFTKWDGTDLSSFKKMVVKVNRLNPAAKIYEIDSISLVQPYFIYEKYEKTNNLEVLFGSKEQIHKKTGTEFNLALELARYIRLLAKNFFSSNYSVNRLGVYQAQLKYSDYTLDEVFRTGLNNLTLTADSLYSTRKRVYFKLRSGIEPFGRLDLLLALNPADSSDFELNYKAVGMSAAMMNPYLLTYSSYPLDRGVMGITGNWKVRNGEIDSRNHLLIVDPRVADRVNSGQKNWLPLRLLFAFVRERSNAIDYEIPVSGNLRNPKFHFKDVILDILENIFLKPPTTFYRYEVKQVEEEVENFIGVNWMPTSPLLSDEQEHILGRINDFLKEHPEARLEVNPVFYNERETEYLASFLARKKYFLKKNNRKNSEFTGDDSLQVLDISDRDEEFIKVVMQSVDSIYSLKQAILAYAGHRKVENLAEALKKARKRNFMDAVNSEQNKNRLIFKAEKDKTPFNGFSFYQISYSGPLPEELRNSFATIQKYDNRKPRSDFKPERKKFRKFFNPR